MDSLTFETMGEIISLCTANRTTDNRVVGRRHSPLSLLDTSIQLCPSVQLRVRCKAERSFFAEEENLYIDCQEQRTFCLRTVASRYLAVNRTILTCDRLQKAMSDVDVVSARFAVPELHLMGLDKNCCPYACHRKVIPSHLPSLSPFSASWITWMRQFYMLRLYSTLFSGSSLFGSCSNFPYAWFLMACFKQTFRRSSACSRHGCSQPSSVCDSCKCNSSTMSNECKRYVGCCSSIECQRETETSGGNSGPANDFRAAPQSAMASECGVVDHRNADVNVSSNNNIEMLPSQCDTIVSNHSIPTCLTAADTVDDSDDDSDYGTTESLNGDISRPNSVCTAPLLAMSRNTDENRSRWSFFIRASDSGSDTSDDDDDGTDAGSDESDGCWDDDDDAGDNNCTEAAQCFLIDLDPLRINGLYIPPTSNVPVSQPQCRSPLPPDSAAEIALEPAGTLKCINETWQQCYNNNVKTKRCMQQRHTKHVCIFRSNFPMLTIISIFSGYVEPELESYIEVEIELN